MYLIPRDAELTNEYLNKVLLDFQTKEMPTLNRMMKYYEGKQKILQKQATDSGRNANKVVVNYCYSIVKNYLGYISGIPVRYNNDEFEDIIKVLNYNDVHQEDTEYLKQALIFGRAFEINYIDEEGKQRFRLFDSRQCFPIYSNDLSNELLYVVRFYKEDLVNKNSEVYIVEVYSTTTVKRYRSVTGFSVFNLLEEYPHFYKQCPVTVFSLNKEEKSIFEQIMSLQDAYNQLLSGEIDDFDSFADAYLMLKGAIADGDDLEAMKKNRVLMLDNDADAKYLTKSISDTQIENMLKNINEQIHNISNSPDFNDEKFMANSGIALRYKLVGFENQAADIEANMKKALQRRIELISEIFNLTNGEETWRDVEIIFTRNLPQSLLPSNPAELMQYKGLVSDETLLAQLPFIKDVNVELEKLNAQHEKNMSLYSFTNALTNNNEEDKPLAD